MDGRFGRRRFISASTAMLALAACSDDPTGVASTLTDGASSSDVGEGSDAAASGDETIGESVDSGDICDATWMTIPDQTWIVGTAIELDLAPYLEGGNAAALVVMLEGVLPDGVVLEGTVLRGTPTAPGQTELVAAVDIDGC